MVKRLSVDLEVVGSSLVCGGIFCHFGHFCWTPDAMVKRLAIWRSRVRVPGATASFAFSEVFAPSFPVVLHATPGTMAKRLSVDLEAAGPDSAGLRIFCSRSLRYLGLLSPT